MEMNKSNSCKNKKIELMVFKKNQTTVSFFNITVYCLLFTVYCFVSSCTDNPQSPGVEYMPDMYRSPSYETYSGNNFYEDSMSARRPVAGTIARGYMPYPYANDTAGYSNAGKFLKNPIPFTPEMLAQGEVLYTKFCVHCHGATGGGDGLVGQKLPGAPPAYYTALKDLPEGKIFHSITYGKGLMGAHAPLLSKEERWKIVYYVQKLQHPGGQAKVDSTKATEMNKKNIH